MKSVEWKDKALTLRDGVVLKSRFWLPIQKGPWPALLMRQPYGREIASTITYAHPSWWAKHGYLVIIQDVRGQGDSQGTFSGFEQEASDTTDTHNWVRSLPECNGRLGTYGFSYHGLTQLLAEANTKPPDCLAPAMTGLDECSHWSCEGGAFWWSIGLMWGLQLAAQKAKREKNFESWEEIKSSLENNSYLKNAPDLLKKHDPKGMAMKWLKNSKNYSNEWKIFKPLETWLCKPMLLIGGWWDPHLNGLLDIHKKSLQAGGKPELHIGPATHLQWWEGINNLHLEFFNRHLKGNIHLNHIQSKEYLWNITSNEWQQSQATGKSNQNWSLRSSGLACHESNDGVLSKSSPGKGIVTIVHDPWRPVQSIGGHLSPHPGKVERGELDQRTDVATFTTNALQESFRLEGFPILTLKAFSDRESFDLCIALSITSVDQKSTTQLSTGFLRVIAPQPIESSLKKIKLQPILADFKKGNRLRISISGSSWPAIGVNPGHTKTLCGAPNSNSLITTISMDLEGSNLQISPFFSK